MDIPPTVKRAISLLAFVQFYVALEVSMLFPMGPILAGALDFNVENLGFLNGAFLAAAFVSGLAGALFLDRFDRRLALVLSLLGLTLGTLLAGFAVDLPSLLACRIVAGLFGGPTAALSLAMVSDLVPVAHRGRALGVVARGGAVALVAGVPLAMQVTEWGGWRVTFFAAAGLGLALAVLMRVGLPEGAGRRGAAGTPVAVLLREMGVILRRRATLLAVAASALMMASMAMIGANIAPYMVFNLSFPQNHLKYLWIAGGLCTLAGSQIAGVLVDRMGAGRMLSFASAAVITVLAFFFVLGPPFASAVVLFSAYNLTHSARMVAMNAVISMVPAPEERGRFMSLVTAGNQLLSALAVVGVAALLHTTPSGALANMNLVGLIAIAGALATPFIAVALRRLTVAH